LQLIDPNADGDYGQTAKPNTVASAIAVLRLLGKSDLPLGVNAIARELSLPPSSCFKILKTLQTEEFVYCDVGTKLYSLGTGAIALARNALDPSQAYTTVRARLEQAAQELELAVGFWRVLPNRRIVLAGFAEGTTQMRIHMSVGQRLPVFMGAVGRAIAAHLNVTTDELRIEFTKLRWNVALSFEEYAAEVARAKEKGYALDEGHFAPGVTTVAVAIADASRAVRYGLSAIMFSGQRDERQIDQLGRQLVLISQWVASRLLAESVRR
jgi:DNA-binding IclR family transcriptional regulator